MSLVPFVDFVLKNRCPVTAWKRLPIEPAGPAEGCRKWCTLRGVRALGIDFGRRRIGLALSDATGLLARPWKSIECRGGIADAAATLAAEVDALAADGDGLAAIVVGYPRRLSGEPNEQTAAVEALAVRLRESTALPVILQDERLSSHEAEQRLAVRETDWRKRKPMLDAASAAIILQDYLDAQPRQVAAPDEDDAQ